MIDDHDLPEDSDKDSDYNPSEESEDSLEYDSEAEDCQAEDSEAEDCLEGIGEPGERPLPRQLALHLGAAQVDQRAKAVKQRAGVVHVRGVVELGPQACHPVVAVGDQQGVRQRVLLGDSVGGTGELVREDSD